MCRIITSTVVSVLLSLPTHAADRITDAQIQQVIDATDVASMNRDAAAIGKYLGESFRKIVEFPYKQWMAKVTVRKDQYLEIIEAGWANDADYYYQRGDTVIHIMPDGLSGISQSTVTENTIQDGETMTSRFREYATYELEHGRLVITEVSGHTLLGDTTPQWQEDETPAATD